MNGSDIDTNDTPFTPTEPCGDLIYSARCWDCGQTWSMTSMDDVFSAQADHQVETGHPSSTIEAIPMIVHQLRHKKLRDEIREQFENRPTKRDAGESATLRRQYRVLDLEPQSHGP